MKIFCIGFHKTGTSSLGTALEILGYKVKGPTGIDNDNLEKNITSIIKRRVDKFDAFQDNPWPIVYRELDQNYPNSKFILTIRETDKWINSAVRHFGEEETTMRKWIYGVGFPKGNEDIYIKRYDRHNQEVREYFKNRPNDLLIIDLSKGDGWKKICPFLGKDIPNTPFPHSNQALAREIRDSKRISILKRTDQFIRKKVLNK